MSKLARAKELADDWAWEAREAAHTAALCHYFDDASPHQLIEMWETGKDLRGKLLDQFETRALTEAWCRVFGELPPEDDDADDPASQGPGQPELDLPADDTMLRTKDVLRITGLSLSTLKRMVIDERFPRPMRISPRRLGWPARDVRQWLEGLEVGAMRPAGERCVDRWAPAQHHRSHVRKLADRSGTIAPSRRRQSKACDLMFRPLRWCLLGFAASRLSRRASGPMSQCPPWSLPNLSLVRCQGHLMSGR